MSQHTLFFGMTLVQIPTLKWEAPANLTPSLFVRHLYACRKYSLHAQTYTKNSNKLVSKVLVTYKAIRAKPFALGVY